MTAASGYDANTGEPTEDKDERELPSTITLLVSPEQSRVLAELEADGRLHLSLVYRGQPENSKKFITAQDEVNAELYLAEQEESEDTPQNPEEKTNTESSEESEVSDAEF